MESIIYTDTTTMSMLLAMTGPQGWAELPTGILHSIIHLLGCTRDVLAFISTCPSWRAAFMEAKPSFCKLLPPLMIRSCAQLSNDAHCGVHHAWQLMDPANPSLRFHRPVPATIPPGMEFVGCSYGHAIFAHLSVSKTGGNIIMIDVFTGVQVSPPPCPKLAKAAAYYMLDFIDLLCCTLTAPISSPKACLLVSTSDIVGRLLVWRIGSDDWQDATTDHDNLGPIDQIVVFKDKLITLDIDLSLYTVHLDDDA
ncbi:hypothetical protein C2845_PM10G00450 [Panicum miliaceum]|uniref:KIB1-4 beta-propeller domain-containing protein n=1 Tax=Panicum miliaceum TaxID=4540 RepID=A0A3L6PDS8_PANMI|nr:hypothetical protein C2845_PM10G00450 [Panicum miliaceum]